VRVGASPDFAALPAGEGVSLVLPVRSEPLP